MKVLVSCESEELQKFIVTCANDWNLSVTEAKTGKDAWTLLRSDESFDAIILSEHLELLSGLEICHLLRTADRRRYPYVILLPISKIAEDYLPLLHQHADDCLATPIDKQVLQARLAVAERISHFTKEPSELGSLLSICSYCRKVKSSPEQWESLEAYIKSHTKTHFSHGICPSCYENQIVPQVSELRTSD